MSTAPTLPPSEAELREQYDRAGLALIGIDFDRAIGTAYIRLGLENAIKGHRRAAARQARDAAIEHQIKESA